MNLDNLAGPLQPAGGYLLAAYSRKLMAIDAASGSAKWSRSDKFPGPIRQIVPTARGVVVGGTWLHSGMTKQLRVWLDLLDPATGESLWPKAPQISGASPFFVRGDTAIQPVNKGLRAFDLASRSQALEVTLSPRPRSRRDTARPSMPNGTRTSLPVRPSIRRATAGSIWLASTRAMVG